MTITQLGEARYASPLASAGADELVVPAELQWQGGAPPDDLMLFEKAGPRQKLFFDPGRARAAIVTCGGLCPGLNNVIRSITRELARGYGAYRVERAVESLAEQGARAEGALPALAMLLHRPDPRAGQPPDGATAPQDGAGHPGNRP